MMMMRDAVRPEYTDLNVVASKMIFLVEVEQMLELKR